MKPRFVKRSRGGVPVNPIARRILSCIRHSSTRALHQLRQRRARRRDAPLELNHLRHVEYQLRAITPVPAHTHTAFPQQPRRRLSFRPIIPRPPARPSQKRKRVDTATRIDSLREKLPLKLSSSLPHYACTAFLARLRGNVNAITAATTMVIPTMANELPTTPVASMSMPAIHGPR